MYMYPEQRGVIELLYIETYIVEPIYWKCILKHI